MTRSFLTAVAALMLTLPLAGCETMSASQCLTGDWAGIGFKDGQQGMPMSRLDGHAKACAASNVQPDVEAYNRGRDDGLRMYCTPRGGFDAGRLGYSYDNVCPKPDDAFVRGYEDGKIVWAAESAATVARSSIAGSESRIRQKREDLRNVERELRNPDLNAEQRRELIDRRNRLADQRYDSIDTVQDAAANLDRAQYDLDRLHEELGRIYGPW